MRLDDMDIDELLDTLLDERDTLRDAIENLALFVGYPGLEKRYAAGVKLASEEIEAIRKEIKRRCYKGTL